MLGLFGTLNLAVRAMQAQQAGVSVSGQNLANVDNPSYSRQRIDLEATISLPTAAGQEGTGVEVKTIEQMRNALLDSQIQQENSVGSYWTAQQTALEDTQTQLGEFLDGTASTSSSSSSTSATSVGLSTQINSLFSAFQAVSADPTSISERQSLVSTAQELATSFNQVSTQLTNANTSLNTSVTNDVASANGLLSDIAQLNEEITQAEAGGNGTANDLRDQREAKLESLAQLGNFTVTNETDGSVTILSGSAVFVTGSNYRDSLQTYDMGNGQLGVKAATGVTMNLSSGSIYGTIAARDGTLATLRSGVDTLASQLASQVNAIYSAGYDLYGNTGGTFFSGTSAATLAVNSALETDPSQVQAAGEAGATSDNTVALALAQLGNQASAALNNQTFSGAYTSLVTDLGNDLSTANDEVTNQNAVSSGLAAQRSSVSGVSMEEEMTNLMTYQKAYQASAQIVSTVNEMLATLIAMKTV